MCSKLHIAYLGKNYPSNLPDKFVDSRQKEIGQFEIGHKDMEKEFINFQGSKYSFKINITEDYSKKEKYKDMSTGEIVQLKKKLREEDA